MDPAVTPAGRFDDRALFRIPPDGEATRFATISGIHLTGSARNPDTGEFVANLNFDRALRKISADGSSVADFTTFDGANAILVKSGK